MWRACLIDAMNDISLDLNPDSLFTLTDKIKASLEGRISWGDTFGIVLGSKNNKHLIVWTPKETSESQILPGFDSKDGNLTLKMKHRPGAWISWIDEVKVQANAVDDYDRVHKSVQELERNTRQITDFADGVISNITVQHLGKSLTLAELTEEVLQVRLSLPNNIKTGGYILAKAGDTNGNLTKVVIPEQTHINRIHLNEDVMLSGIDKEDYDTVLVVIRTHNKVYPDLLDLEYSLTLQTQLNAGSDNDSHRPVKILTTAAIINSLEPNNVKLAPYEFNASEKEIEDAIAKSSEKIDEYTLKANPHAYQLMVEYQQGVESRLKALMLNRGQRIHNKVWDDLVLRELRNTLNTFCNFYTEYLDEHFDESTSRETSQLLRQKIEPIIDFWQIEETQQLTYNQMIQSSYTLTNQVVDHASALVHDLVFKTELIETGLVKPVELKIYSNEVLQDKIYLPEWTSGTVREKMTRIGLRSNFYPQQIERIRNVWLTLLEIANFASQNNQNFEQIIQPMDAILLSTKSSTAQRNKQTNRRTTKFPGFEFGDSELNEIIKQIEDHYSIIKLWIKNATNESERLSLYYTTMWSLILNGKARETLLSDTQPACEINISDPDQTKRLMNLTLSSQLVVENEKDRKNLERNLNRVVLAKTGHHLRDITSIEKLAIHGDITLSLLREELIRYDETLTKRASRLTTPQRKTNKRNAVNLKSNGQVSIESIQAEQTKVTDMISFLKPYGESDAISKLANAGLNKNGSEIDEFRKQQVLSFDLNELPSIGNTWLTEIKTLDDYPNLRVFLLQNKLPISTTGRILMELRKTLSDNLFNQVLGLIQEVKELNNSSYQGEVLDRFIAYISEKVWRWELTQITAEELPVVVKEKVLTSAVCYEKEVENLMEYAERYDELLETKLNDDSEMDVQRENLESRFQEIVETLL